jgi:hypothetical protein
MSFSAQLHPHPQPRSLRLTRVVRGFNLRELSARTEIDPRFFPSSRAGAVHLSVDG